MFDTVRLPARPHRTEALVLDTPVQTSLDDGVPLREVTFCVVDLETTGGSPADS
jgi:DNA polymerase III subunit epsilon